VSETRPPYGDDAHSGRDRFGEPVGEPPINERGRDLTLLALAIVVIIEGAFAIITVSGASEGRLVLAIGRFALISGLSFMTWRGFAVPRWLLVFLTAVAAIGGPIAVSQAMDAGSTIDMVVASVAMIGYATSALLLAFSRHVREFLQQRRALL
jgi:hypothetical protein